MKIEEGKFYRTRDGQKLGPMALFRTTADNDLVWVTGDGSSCRFLDGSFNRTKESPGDLVAEWTEGPVREVTVTRKEIVAGKYGRLEVVLVPMPDEHGGVSIMLLDRNGKVHGAYDKDPALMTVPELRAAAATLIELADALEGTK